MQKKHLVYAGKQTSDDADFASWIPFSLHDFGARGVSSSESAILGGAGHIFNFMGSDTLEAADAVDRLYGVREGFPAYSVVATEHSVLCSEGQEGEFSVIERVFDTYKNAPIISCVNDTYNMDAHLDYLGTVMKDRIVAWGGRWVTRPDSGIPSESVLRCLDKLSAHFGYTINSKGYKVLPSCVRVIQGDGIDEEELVKVLFSIQNAGYCVTNVVFGSGGGLLQKVNRDTQRFAMKASYLEVNGEGREVFKQPTTDMTKQSKKGKVSLYCYNSGGIYVTLTEVEAAKAKGWIHEVLVPVYSNGKILKEYSLDEVRANTGLW
jgi:nicotinamide phosphoribosyltransferase